LNIIKSLLAPFPCVPFDEVDATYYATIRHELELQGQVIGPYDLQIAAICLRHEFVLVTNNVSEFSRVSGLKVQDWTQVAVEHHESRGVHICPIFPVLRPILDEAFEIFGNKSEYVVAAPEYRAAATTAMG
jgi:hypothetical protein